MEAVVAVREVKAVPTRSGNTRYVLVDEDGNEYTTFRPEIGNRAQEAEGKRARIEYHEEQRGNFNNVYLDKIEACQSNDIITVVMPQFLPSRWWHNILHNQTALWLKARLLFRGGTVVTSVPSHVLEEGKIKAPIPPTTTADGPSARSPS